MPFEEKLRESGLLPIKEKKKKNLEGGFLRAFKNEEVYSMGSENTSSSSWYSTGGIYEERVKVNIRISQL